MQNTQENTNMHLYEDRIICYIDILGFKRIIDDSTKRQMNPFIANMLRFMKTAINDDKNDSFSSKCNLQIVQFSDTIVASINKFSCDEINWFINKICYLCEEFAKGAVFLRGAIVVGPVYHKSDIIFGPGIVSAYNAESKNAFYPRIVFDDSFFMRTKCKDILIENFITRDFDGMYFIDYIAKSTLTSGDRETEKEYLEQIKDALISYLYRIDDLSIWLDRSTRQKLEWLRTRYNLYIDQLQSYASANGLDDERVLAGDLPTFE